MSKVIEVNMNGIECSTEEYPIIGTTALATCVGFLAYDANQKKAMVSHLAPSDRTYIVELLKKMNEEQFISDIEYKQCMKILLLFNEYDLFEFNASLKEQLKKMDEYKIPERKNEEKIEIRIIDGFYKNHTNNSKHILDFFSYLNSIFYVNKNILSKKDVSTEMISKTEGFKSFYFNALNGQFVTQEVLKTNSIDNTSQISM